MTQLDNQFQSVHFRHTVVGNDHIKGVGLLLDLLQRILAVLGGGNPVADFLQQGRMDVQHIGRIVHQQDMTGFVGPDMGRRSGCAGPAVSG